MKVLGIRNYNKGFRYSIIENINDTTQCLNLTTENKVLIPKDCSDTQLTQWYKDEIDRILNQHKDIQAIAIKHNENNSNSCYTNLKFTMFMDCIVTLEGTLQKIPVFSYCYSQLHTNSREVLDKAKAYVGKSEKYWDQQFADSILAAIKTIQDENESK